MLIPFAIDPDSVESASVYTAAQTRAQREAFFDIWKHYGVIVYNGRTFQESRLYDAIQALPVKTRLQWLQQLTQVPKIAAGPDWNGFVHNDQLDYFQASHIALALIDDRNAAMEFDFHDSLISKTPPGRPELCRIGAAHCARSFQHARLLAGAPIPAGSDCGQLWAQRFRTLAQANLKHISIVDRHALHRHFADRKNSGLAHFLNRLDTDARHLKHIMLYTEATAIPLSDVQNELRQLLAGLPRHRIDTLSMTIIPAEVFLQHSPGSYIRFANYLWDIGCGLDLFAQPLTQQLTLVSFKSGGVVQAYKNIEQQLAGQRLLKISLP